MMMGMNVPAPLCVGLMVVTIGLGSAIHASGVDHYEGEPSDSLQQAVENFSDYNAKLAEVLERDPMSMAEAQQIHEYTYTLERALAKMRDDLGALAVTLEEVHQASEGEDFEALRAATRRYLEASAPLE